MTENPCGDTWLAWLVEHRTLRSQGHELKPHVGYRTYLKKKKIFGIGKKLTVVQAYYKKQEKSQKSNQIFIQRN